ncbi:MAG: hypothetical protein LRY55_05085 [Leadbetterella sp.]|nr:hypothetical protein [Leadbetterella sp.]
MYKKTSALKTILLLPGFCLAAALLLTACGSSDIQVRVSPDSALKINAEYPPFKAGVVTLEIKGETHKIPITGIDESTYKNLPRGSYDEEVSAVLESDYWKLADSQVKIDKSMNLKIVPNGRLSGLYGTVIDDRGRPVREALIQIGNDTALYSNQQGMFKAELSYGLQKENQRIMVLKDGYEAVELTHTPGNNLLVHLKRGGSPGQRVVIREGQQQKGETFGEWAAKEGVRTGSDVIRSRARRY